MRSVAPSHQLWWGYHGTIVLIKMARRVGVVVLIFLIHSVHSVRLESQSEQVLFDDGARAGHYESYGISFSHFE